MKHAVILDSAHGHYAYGPFDDVTAAEEFAHFLTAEVDPARVIRLTAPLDELLGWWHHKGLPAADYRPEYWPPKPGHIWQDRNKDRWVGTGAGGMGYLVCLAHQGDDQAEVIWQEYGPMTFVRCIEPREEEVPF